MQDMGIKLKTPISEVTREMQSVAKLADALTLRALTRLGEECVIKARDRSQEESWFDHTGNLRSSIGYIIARNGNIVGMSDFQPVRGGSEGSKTGKEYAEEIARQFYNSYVLVVVAGMNYAEHVEAMDNKDVLATPELYAKERLPKMMEKLKKQLIA